MYAFIVETGAELKLEKRKVPFVIILKKKTLHKDSLYIYQKL